MKNAFLTILVFIGITAVAQDVKRDILITKKYLNIPIQQSTDRQRITFNIDGSRVRYFNARLSKDKTDYWVFADVSEYKGKTITLNYPVQVAGLDMIYQDDKIAGSDSLYMEEYRPRFHFTSRRGWNNDPNGLVYYKGEYHLFYQHNPMETEWENMTWGHAVSKDLIHWKELAPALYPDELGAMFSGSAVVDVHNTSGFQTGKEKTLVAAYTAHGEFETQCIAFSNDRGRSWQKYRGNPVIDSRGKWGNSRDSRDPKVFWHGDSRKWVMILFENKGHSVYNSDNLKDWSYLSHLPGFWECPELFELPVDGNPNNKKWVIYGAAGDYLIGRFDGRQFTADTDKQQYFKGKMYAAQTFSNIPEKDGRRIQIGWGQISHPGMPFNMMMTFPTKLTLKTTDSGIKMFSEPVEEIKSLHKRKMSWDPAKGGSINEKLALLRGSEFHIKLRVSGTDLTSFLLDGNPIIDTAAQRSIRTGLYGGGESEGRHLDLEILIDRTSIEVFAGGGEFSLILPRITSGERSGLSFRSPADIQIQKIEVAELKSIWK